MRSRKSPPHPTLWPVKEAPDNTRFSGYDTIIYIRLRACLCTKQRTKSFQTLAPLLWLSGLTGQAVRINAGGKRLITLAICPLVVKPSNLLWLGHCMASTTLTTTGARTIGLSTRIEPGIRLNPVSRVSTHNAHLQKQIPLRSIESASIGGLNPDWSINHKAHEMASSAWSVEETSTDYRAGNLHLTCKQSLATCTYLGLLLCRKFAHIHKRVDNVEVAVVHSKVEGAPAKLH